jgi:ABC-type bacteriocin/lantibiotic exporter with double-glycine peptidase domain
MKHIYQRYASDCFPTCIAMVSGIPYAEAVRRVHPFRFKGWSYETTDERGIQVLRSLGFKVRKRYLDNFSKLKHPAIIAVNLDGSGHVVVWDPIRRKILDPYSSYGHEPTSFYEKHMEYVLILS